MPSKTALPIALLAAALLALPACENSNSPDQVSAPASSNADHDDHAGHDHDHADHDHSDHDHEADHDTAKGTDSATPADEIRAEATGDRVFAADFSFALPEGWEQRPPSNSMRLLELAAPKTGDATAPVAALSLAGGDIDANIARWQGQFAEPDAQKSRETRQIAGATVHLVEMAGSFRGMGGPLQENTVMRAAIVERPGQPNLFIKMTGQADAMNAAAEGWAALIESMTSP
jgi:hypothetical protein